jgi:hypothetical protein
MIVSVNPPLMLSVSTGMLGESKERLASRLVEIDAIVVDQFHAIRTVLVHFIK